MTPTAPETDPNAVPQGSSFPVSFVSDYPRIIFQPELHNMRHHKLQQLVYEHAETSQSLLDIGCGDGALTKRFICDYEGALHKCPLQRVDGIDIEDTKFRPGMGVLEEIDNALHTERWTPMAVHIMKGSFQVLEGCGKEMWDLVLACEVVEHLDPEPLADFPRIVLGELKPDVFIVTTPDRRFNRIFDILSKYQPDSSYPVQRYKWPGVDYEMRHSDHRFEWTSSEFHSWAKQQASTYGYTVTFDGVGGFGGDPFYSAYLCGMDSPEMRLKFFKELANEGISDACCSQIAIFKRKDVSDHPPIQPPTMDLPSHLTPLLVYQCRESGHSFPPSSDAVWLELAASDFREFLCPEYYEVWDNFRNPYSGHSAERWEDVPQKFSRTMTYGEVFDGGNHQLRWMCHNDVEVFRRIILDAWRNIDMGRHKNFRAQIYDVWPKFGDEVITLRYEFSPNGAVWWDDVESPSSSIHDEDMYDET